MVAVKDIRKGGLNFKDQLKYHINTFPHTDISPSHYHNHTHSIPDSGNVLIDLKHEFLETT
jgi:hypothetical protein